MSIARYIITGVAGIGIVSAGAWTLDNTTRNETGSIVEAGDLGVFNFVVGDCIKDLPTDGEVSQGTGVPCSQPHDVEVYFEDFLTDKSVNLPNNISDVAEEYCYNNFEEFVGISYEESELQISSIFPTAESWKNGDKEITCLIAEKNNASSTGSLRGANR